MNLIRILIVLLLGLGLGSCGSSDSSDKPATNEAAAPVEAADTAEAATQETGPSTSRFLDSVNTAKKAAEKMEDAGQARVDQIEGALGEEEEEEEE